MGRHNLSSSRRMSSKFVSMEAGCLYRFMRSPNPNTPRMSRAKRRWSGYFVLPGPSRPRVLKKPRTEPGANSKTRRRAGRSLALDIGHLPMCRVEGLEASLSSPRLGVACIRSLYSASSAIPRITPWMDTPCPTTKQKNANNSSNGCGRRVSRTHETLTAHSAPTPPNAPGEAGKRQHSTRLNSTPAEQPSRRATSPRPIRSSAPPPPATG